MGSVCMMCREVCVCEYSVCMWSWCVYGGACLCVYGVRLEGCAYMCICMPVCVVCVCVCLVYNEGCACVCRYVSVCECVYGGYAVWVCVCGQACQCV